jgi:hypothetical protein
MSIGFEALFSVMLDHATPTNGSIRALRLAALGRLPDYADTWAALHAALLDVGRDGGTKTQALWYTVDALLQAAPLVFGPVIAPRLPELVQEAMPWAEAWCAPLVAAWASVLPREDAAGLVEAAARMRSTLLLDAEIAAQTSAGADAAETTPATRNELAELEDCWGRLEGAVARHGPKIAGGVTVKLESAVKREVKQEQQQQLAMHAAALVDVGNTAADAIDADEDYEPDYVAGASTGRLAAIDVDAAAMASATAATAAAAPAPEKRERRKRPR